MMTLCKRFDLLAQKSKQVKTSLKKRMKVGAHSRQHICFLFPTPQNYYFHPSSCCYGPGTVSIFFPPFIQRHFHFICFKLQQ